MLFVALAERYNFQNLGTLFGSRAITEFDSMPHIIAQPCIGTKDTACVTVCPVDCIHPTKDEPKFATEEMLYIDPETCIDCGLCVDECPVKAIFPEEDLPVEWVAFTVRNKEYYTK
jgi:ferredoxin